VPALQEKDFRHVSRGSSFTRNWCSYHPECPADGGRSCFYFRGTPARTMVFFENLRFKSNSQQKRKHSFTNKSPEDNAPFAEKQLLCGRIAVVIRSRAFSYRMRSCATCDRRSLAASDLSEDVLVVQLPSCLGGLSSLPAE